MPERNLVVDAGKVVVVDSWLKIGCESCSSSELAGVHQTEGALDSGLAGLQHLEERENRRAVV